MINKHDVIDVITKRTDDDTFELVYNQLEDALYFKETGNFCTSMDQFVEECRKAAGESFTLIFNDEMCLFNVVKCKECGTIIFRSDNYEDYEPNFRCPICTDYKTDYEFWTKEDVENDIEKQKVICMYDDIMKYEAACEVRRIRRNGKLDSQILIKDIWRGTKKSVTIYLNCIDITESYFKGLNLEIHLGKKDHTTYNPSGYALAKVIRIPLTWSGIYEKIRCRHLSKTKMPE